MAFDVRESVQLLGVSSSALFRSGSVPNNPPFDFFEILSLYSPQALMKVKFISAYSSFFLPIKRIRGKYLTFMENTANLGLFAQHKIVSEYTARKESMRT